MNTLKDAIAAYEVMKAEKVPAYTLAVMNQATVNLVATEIDKQTLKTGDKVPAFSLPNQNNEVKSLPESLVVLSFYRGGWCPYCNFELGALQKLVPEFEAAGARLIAITPENPDHSMSTKEKNELTFEILSDEGNKVAKQFGLVFTLPTEIQSIYNTFGIDVNKHNGDDTFELPIPATYVINSAGEIVYHFVNSDYTQRSEPSDVLAAVKALS